MEFLKLKNGFTVNMEQVDSMRPGANGHLLLYFGRQDLLGVVDAEDIRHVQQILERHACKVGPDKKPHAA